MNHGLGIRIHTKIPLAVGARRITPGMMRHVSPAVEGVGACGAVDPSIGVTSCGTAVRAESGRAGENAPLPERLMLLPLPAKCMIT